MFWKLDFTKEKISCNYIMYVMYIIIISISIYVYHVL